MRNSQNSGPLFPVVFTFIGTGVQDVGLESIGSDNEEVWEDIHS